MDKKPYDDSNWREDYKQYTSNKRHLELLENGPKQLSQAWVLVISGMGIRCTV